MADQPIVSWLTSEISRFSEPFIVLIAVKETFYIGWPISTVENNQFLVLMPDPYLAYWLNINKN